MQLGQSNSLFHSSASRQHKIRIAKKCQFLYDIEISLYISSEYVICVWKNFSDQNGSGSVDNYKKLKRLYSGRIDETSQGKSVQDFTINIYIYI